LPNFNIMNAKEIITILIALIGLIISLYNLYEARKEKIRSIRISYEFKEAGNGDENRIALCVKISNDKKLPILITEIGLITKRKARILIYENIYQPIKIETFAEYIHPPFNLSDEIIDKSRLITKLYAKGVSGKLYILSFDTLYNRLIFFYASKGLATCNNILDTNEITQEKINFILERSKLNNKTNSVD